MAFVSSAIAAASTAQLVTAAVATAGALASGVAAYASASYQSQIAKMNQRVATENAQRARQRASVEQVDIDTETLSLLGAQEAAQAASGLNIMGTSQVRTRSSARQLGRRDALNRIHQGELEAYNFEVDAANAGARGKLASLQGKGSLITSFLQAGRAVSPLFGGAAFNPQAAGSPNFRGLY